MGAGLARTLAGDSWLAEVVGFFALPVAFAIGMQAWFGLALLSLIPRLLGRARKESGVPPSSGKPAATRPLAGAAVFLPLSSAAGAIAGVTVGLLPGSHSFWTVALVFWLVGTLHGALAWRLAKAGYLMPPDSA